MQKSERQSSPRMLKRRRIASAVPLLPLSRSCAAERGTPSHAPPAARPPRVHETRQMYRQYSTRGSGVPSIPSAPGATRYLGDTAQCCARPGPRRVSCGVTSVSPPEISENRQRGTRPANPKRHRRNAAGAARRVTACSSSAPPLPSPCDMSANAARAGLSGADAPRAAPRRWMQRSRPTVSHRRGSWRVATGKRGACDAAAGAPCPRHRASATRRPFHPHI